ncbi:MAG: hypothetical protein ACJ8OJ_17625 [Povalibacter sp.]
MISDNDLLLYYYRDGLDEAERARIAAALGAEPELAARLHRLIARLDAASAVTDVPVPDHVQRRWESALHREAAGTASAKDETRRRTIAGGYWRTALAACAVALLVMTVKVALPPSSQQIVQQGTSTRAAVTTESGEPLAYERGLQLHLASTEQQLGDLNRLSDEERSRLINTIIAQNRLYAIAADRANEPQLARVLRAFTPVLERVASDHGNQTAGAIAQLNFEMKVMQTRLNAAMNPPSSADTVAL